MNVDMNSLCGSILMHYTKRFLAPRSDDSSNKAEEQVVMTKNTSMKSICTVLDIDYMSCVVVRVSDDGFEVLNVSGPESVLYRLDPTNQDRFVLASSCSTSYHLDCSLLTSTVLRRVWDDVRNRDKGFKSQIGIVTLKNEFVVVSVHEIRPYGMRQTRKMCSGMSSTDFCLQYFGVAEMEIPVSIQSCQDATIWSMPRDITFESLQLIVHSFCLQFLQGASCPKLGLQSLWKLACEQRATKRSLRLVDMIHRWIFWFVWGYDWAYLQQSLILLPSAVVNLIREFITKTEDMYCLHLQFDLESFFPQESQKVTLQTVRPASMPCQENDRKTNQRAKFTLNPRRLTWVTHNPYAELTLENDDEDNEAEI